jgi:hypothetical protein
VCVAVIEVLQVRINVAGASNVCGEWLDRRLVARRIFLEDSAYNPFILQQQSTDSFG